VAPKRITAVRNPACKLSSLQCYDNVYTILAESTCWRFGHDYPSTIEMFHGDSVLCKPCLRRCTFCVNNSYC
jgi:hypothetical protein